MRNHHVQLISKFYLFSPLPPVRPFVPIVKNPEDVVYLILFHLGIQVFICLQEAEVKCPDKI